MKTKQMLLLMAGFFFLLGSQCFAAEQAAYNWKNVAIGGGGFVSSVIAAPNDPNVFYARTDVGGAYRWDEAAQAWISLLDWVSSDEKGYLGVDGIAVDPKVPGRVYVLLGIGYLNNGESAFARSENYGRTWEVFDITNTFKAHGNGMGRGNGERLAVDPNNSNIIFAGTRFNGMWKSTNRGTTWSQLSLDYRPNINRDMHESGVCTLQFDRTSVASGVTQTIYAGISRESNNVYVSHNAGASWSLVAGQPTAGLIRPQRMALTSDGRYLYITYGNGGGPHPMLWSGVTDYFNRGAIYKYDTQEGTWKDVSPENFMQNLDQIPNNDFHQGAFSGISIDPNDENVILATAINSWRAPQFWYMDGKWVDSWGDNIYLSEDGGATWREMFRYYWMDGGYFPDYDMIDDNGFPWIVGEKVHWNAAIVIDPSDSNRALVASGNGVFVTDNLHDSYTTTEWVNNVQQTTQHGKATWKFFARGIEETVPLDLVSLPGGPLVSVVGDYDGFVHEDLSEPSANGRLTTMVNGAKTHIGTTTGLAYAVQKPNLLAKAGGNSANANGQNVSICGVSLSSDGGVTWNQIYNSPTGVSVTPVSGSFFKGEVAMSADGAVVLWSPMSTQSSGDAYHPELFRYLNSGWTKSQGVEFSCDPEADSVNANLMYAYNRRDGYMYVSLDKGVTFTRRGLAGTSDYWTVRAVPGIEGDVWVPLSGGGLTRSTNAGQSFAPINGVSWCEAVGFGKAAPGAAFPTVYIYGTVDGVTGVFRSTDQGASWVRVNDNDHEYGGPGDASIVIGDMNVFGRVYMTTAGRGVVYGEPAGSAVAVTGVSVAPTAATIDAGATVRITATVTPANATNKAVTWRSSNTAIATVNTSGVVTGVAAGSATISAVTADGGFSAGATVRVNAVTTNRNPVAAISATPLSGNAPLVVNFSAAGSSDPDGDALSYAWTFGDGGQATGVTAAHTYATAGLMTATVTVSDGRGGSGTASAQIDVRSTTTTKYTLTTQTVGSGTISRNPAATGNQYDAGTVVTLTASAASGYQFAGWSGDASGTSASISITMNANKTVTATFSQTPSGSTCDNPTAISIPFTQNGVGQFCWVTTQAIEYINSWNLNKLTINGVDFTNKWSNSLPAAVNGRWVIAYDGLYAWSHFEAPQAKTGSGDNPPQVKQFKLTAATLGSGSITMSPAGGVYNEGTVVTLTATPTAGYRFDSWSGAVSGSSTSVTVTMNADKSVVASFVEVEDPVVEYELSVTVEGSGSVSPVGGLYAAGTVVTLTATPRSGYVFDGWSGDASGSTTSIQVTMNANKAVTATFTAESSSGGCDGWRR
jgi:uncharacterized repeat protein (TIGR02543 family)